MVFYRLTNSQKAKKCEILNLEVGKVVQRSGYKAVGHKLRGKIRIVGNFNTEMLQLTTFWYLMGKKNALRTTNLKGRERSFLFFCPYSKFRTKNLPIVKEQEITYVKNKKTRKYN